MNVINTFKLFNNDYYQNFDYLNWNNQNFDYFKFISKIKNINVFFLKSKL